MKRISQTHFLPLLIVASPCSFAGITDTPLSQALVPFHFGNAEGGPLKQRLIASGDTAEMRCQTEHAQDPNHSLCLWARVVKEFLLSGASLASNAYDSDQLMVTLASRLHPFDLAGYVEKGKDFDSRYARLLIAQRLLRDLWPSVKENLKSKAMIDDWFIPWLESLTPMSFMLNLSRYYTCLNQTCPEKRAVLGVLQSVVAAIDQDTSLSELLKLLQSSTASAYADKQTDLVFKKLLSGLSDDGDGVTIDLSASENYSEIDADAIRLYLDSVDHDAQTPITRFMTMTGQACADFNGALQLAKQEANFDWPGLVAGVQCASGDFASAAYDRLQSGHVLWRFNFYYIRLIISSHFQLRPDGVAKSELKLAQIHEILTDIECAMQQARGIEKVTLRDDEYARLKPQMSVLYNYMLQTERAAEAALHGRDK